ncbi:5'-AMP-activated serine/threonine-protein kinase catalytic subunit alpha [Condylostylus longicornis]|uniref:5'-AMP-activated serine/threonine-protein kinase catalytic subunit alpha n=1 Tax=Condylostylus longicornis TaxID=2530218 RepID=UPI00244E1341|nr:5'-AMP-activated serine/threonine-protein kinase catalytic subunit alpha [Condylostylus longicornis]XP_055375002.1 5'-AMP-activated serine/threonine-protein kinase catalytic subunit alpha [Condylostylus longicornis]XP_055375003.1 5'-AMP-activated serine/threonine-protein kinase catalytic subunit alpha [Condylostylus longicornis]XP_055375004.1 5'-AMP-activated serine/threonine-protein kinase catalytic subunit alpha [Condylostylus longicornis]
MVVDEANMASSLHPSGVPQNQIDNIMSGVSNTGNVKMNNHRKKLRQRFDIIKKLGQGTYGKVQLGINKETGQEVAIKTIKKCKIEQEADLIRIRREVQIMSSVQHPNIIHIYEVFENREKMVLVMEFAAGGELYDYLSERKVLTEDEARRIFRQIATAVYYCHKHKICHRDLKLENILLDENGNAKIADFGLSNLFDNQKCLTTFCGSPLYASPEIVKGTPYEGPEVDCWSLGVLLYTLVYGSMPFDGSNFKRLVKQISQGDYYEPKNPSKASSLIREMLTVSPQQRANIEQICNHWWVNTGYDESCLELAEALANQTPVRLDVLLSLSPTNITAEQLVVPSAESSKSSDKVNRSLSVGNVPEIVNSEAERKILEMVATCGEEALMPSPTRTIPNMTEVLQTKRKLSSTVSTDQVNQSLTKKEKPSKASSVSLNKEYLETGEVLAEEEPCQMETSDANVETSQKVENQQENDNLENSNIRNDSLSKTNSAKIIKKFVNKHKTADLVSELYKISPEKLESSNNSTYGPMRKTSLPELNNDRRLSKTLEAAAKFENSFRNSQNKIAIRPESDTLRKIVENKQNMNDFINSIDKLKIERTDSPNEVNKNIEYEPVLPKSNIESPPPLPKTSFSPQNSLSSLSLLEAKKSMQNSIALLNQAKQESVSLSSSTDFENERERKLRNAREVIGNAISSPKMSPEVLIHQVPICDDIKTSKAEITLKSATLPRRKTAKAEIQLKMQNPPQPPLMEQPMMYATEMQHQLPDLRSAPIMQSFNRSNSINKYLARASSVGPVSPSTESNRYPFSTKMQNSKKLITTPRYESQSSNDSSVGITSATSSSQAIRKSPREFIIPIAMEGGGYITPKNLSMSAANTSKSSIHSNTNSFNSAISSRHLRNFESQFSKPQPQYSDSQSSGEEDDDDGFEILTAENLFSTLLQRVRALTNRLNINNELTNYQNSRILSNIKPSNQLSWTRDPTSRLHSSIGSSPWKYSISRNFGPEFGSSLMRPSATSLSGSEYHQKYKNKFV